MNHRAIYEKGKAVFNVRGRLQMTSSPRARGVCQKVNGDMERGGGENDQSGGDVICGRLLQM